MQKLKATPTFFFVVLLTIGVTVFLCQSTSLTGVQAQTSDPGYPAPVDTPGADTNDVIAGTSSEISAYPAPGEETATPPTGESNPSETQDYSAWDKVVISILGDPKSPKKLGNFTRLPDPVITWDKEKKEQIQAAKAKIVPLTKAEADELNAKKGMVENSEYLNFSLKHKVKITPGIEADWALVVEKGDSSKVFGVVQFQQPMTGDAQQELMQAGVKFYDYIDGGGAFCQMPSQALPTLRKLIQEGRILYAGPIPKDVRIAQDLYDRTVKTPEEQVPVNLILFEAPDKKELQQVSQFVKNLRQPTLGSFEFLSGTIRAGDALQLSNLPFVRWVEIFYTAKVENLTGRMSAGSDIARVWSLGGTDVNIGILDTGIAQNHLALQNFRFVDQHDYIDGDDIADPVAPFGGHGSWVAGIAAGYDQGNTDFMGHAPLSNLLIYKLSTGLGGFQLADVTDALQRGTNAGMNIANMSFGFEEYSGNYTSYSLVADQAVRGQFGRPITVVAAVGNHSGLIIPPATAKNVISVGAVKDGSGPDNPGSYENCTDSHFNWPPATVACFSGHGPLDNDIDTNKRIKPDLVAPGVGINAAYPLELDAPGQIGFDGVQDGYNKGDGTSAAAPAVSGAAALMMQLYPSMRDWPELAKATLIASAIDLGDTDHYGHGLLNAAHATYAQDGVGGLTFLGGGVAQQNDATQTFTFDAKSHFTRLRAVLAFSDIPGDIGHGETSNDLDLYIYPNSTCSGSYIASSAHYDDTVEVIDYTPTTPPSQTQTWCARVRTYRYYTDSYGAPTYGLAIYEEELAPYVLLDGWTDLDSIFPGANFSLYTTITNWGNVVAGSYIQLDLPHYGQDFPLVGADVYAADGTHHYYPANQLTGAMVQGYQGYIYYIPTGMVLRDNPRLIRWIINAPRGTPYGSYGFRVEGAYETKNGRVMMDYGFVNMNIVPPAAQIYLPVIMNQ